MLVECSDVQGLRIVLWVSHRSLEDPATAYNMSSPAVTPPLISDMSLELVTKLALFRCWSFFSMVKGSEALSFTTSEDGRDEV